MTDEYQGKYCRACEHFRDTDYGGERCTQERDENGDFKSTFSVRNYGSCGPSGRLFEPRKPQPRRARPSSGINSRFALNMAIGFGLIALIGLMIGRLF